MKETKLKLSTTPTIGVVIPTFQGAKHLPHCLPFIVQSPLKPRVLIIDSSSSDDTCSIAEQWGAETLVIPQNQFNHGLTREMGRKYLNTDIVVMLTQDAYATSPSMLTELVRPLLLKEASIAYAKQIPHAEAGFFESFPRRFNYPETSHTRSLADLSQYGVYTFFCSNSCAAYCNNALDEVGGFPDVLFGEDTVAVAKLLHRNHKIAYIASAEVKHSHAYSLKQEFCRHFDIGLARNSYRTLITAGGKDTKRGTAYFKALLAELMQNNPHLIPYACLQTALKLIGYRLGQTSSHAPLWLKQICSSQKYYWKSKI